MSTLRKLAWAEGISFLLLLGVAMPLKYLAGRPGAVKVFGWAHGALFVLFCAALAAEARRRRWPLKWIALVFFAGLVPGGPFLLDRRIARYEAPPGPP